MTKISWWFEIRWYNLSSQVVRGMPGRCDRGLRIPDRKLQAEIDRCSSTNSSNSTTCHRSRRMLQVKKGLTGHLDSHNSAMVARISNWTRQGSLWVRTSRVRISLKVVRLAGNWTSSANYASHTQARKNCKYPWTNWPTIRAKPKRKRIHALKHRSTSREMLLNS